MSKKALLIGINEYSISQHNLRGCVNDIAAISSLAQTRYGFAAEDVEILMDSAATSVAIIEKLKHLVSGLSHGDVRLFYFSGHGVQKNFNVPGEEDERDEAIVPYEMTYSSLIEDNTINEIIAQNVDPSQVHFTAVFDACHSGTMIRELEYDENGRIVTNVLNRCIFFDDLQYLALREVAVGPFNTLSACGDSETAADLRQINGDNTPRGAFSYALHEALKANPSTKIRDLEGPIINSIKGVSNHTQNPVYHVVQNDVEFLPL